MLILKGGQGIGKSTFFNVLCGEKYYQENLSDLKKTFESTQGKWFVEIGELDAMKKAEATAIKTYITLRKETYRVPYERTSRDYYRRFVLIGTTNDNDFLVDETGNRRFIVLECARNRKSLKESVLSENAQYEIRQALAEVFQEYKEGKKFLVVPEEFEEYIEMKNRTYIMSDGLEGLVEEFLEDKDKCCIMQIWDECIERQRKWKYSKTMSNRISNIIVNLPDWHRYDKSKTGKTNFSSFYTDEMGRMREKKYGKQVVFVKEKEPKKDYFKENSNALMNDIYKTENEDYFMEV